MGVTIDVKISHDSSKASLCYWSSHQTLKMYISDIDLVAVSCSSKGGRPKAAKIFARRVMNRLQSKSALEIYRTFYGGYHPLK